MTLPLTALSESSIHFANVVSFKSSGFYRKRVTMCYYVQLCGNVQVHLQLQSSV